MLFDYNSLNLLSEVRRDGQPAAKYDWLADGTKLGVCDGSGTDGFEYVGSLIYRKSNSGLHLGEALFGDGVIRVNENGTQEVDYFLTDHLGSVRVIVDAAGAVKERNDYYPFGARHVRSDYALSTNRWKYNGKELQTTGDLGFLDYGARMYDAGLGRWFCADPLSESSLSQTPYHYCYNDPLNLTDPDGMYADHWMYDLTSGNVSWMSDLGGSDYQFISFVHPGSDGGYVLDKQISLSGSSFYIGPVSGGLLASNVDYWKSMPSGLSGYQGYRYDLSDLRMRLDVFNGSSHHLKVALSNWESRGIAEPLTSNNYWATYGHTMGMLNLWSDYMSAGVGLSAGAMGGKGQSGPRRFRHVPMYTSFGKGYTSFYAFKTARGAAGEGMAWHHIVEQTPGNIRKFGVYRIHNTGNLIRLPHGKGSIHAQISAHYSSKQRYTHGLTVRRWLSTQSYEAQYFYGINQLTKLGWKR